MTRMQRFEKAALALAAGRKVSVPVRELPQGPAAWLQELKTYLIVNHSDPCDELRFKVTVLVKDGKAIASATVVLFDE